MCFASHCAPGGEWRVQQTGGAQYLSHELHGAATLYQAPYSMFFLSPNPPNWPISRYDYYPCFINGETEEQKSEE